MGNKISLGVATPLKMAVASAPQSLEEKVEMLSQQVAQLTKAFHAVNSVRMKDKRKQEMYEHFPATTANKDGIPEGITLLGQSHRGGVHVLMVNNDGYYIGIRKFDSLSAAAEASSGVRRSGWTYWKLPDGRSVKEAFGKR